MKSFRNVIQGIGEKISGDAQKLHEKIVSIDANELMEPGQKLLGVLWESNENVEACRECRAKLQQIGKRKHHCRQCGGVFCDSCCPEYDSNGDTLRICNGCVRGETPGEVIKNKVRTLLESEAGKEDLDAVEKFQNKLASKVAEVLRVPGAKYISGHAVVLSRDRLFNDESPKGSPPISGYFELCNKSSEIMCIKLLFPKSNLKFEVPRPSYWTVPPGCFMSAFFDPSIESLDLFILWENISSISNDSALVFDTRAHGVTQDKISRCARVSEFQKVFVYTLNACQKNILLKYKGNGIVMCRNGDSIFRVGLVGKLQGKQFIDNKIDYSTNISDPKLLFSC